MSDYLQFLHQREDTAPVKTILLVDDSADVRHVVRRFLERDPSFKVCGEAGNGPEAIKKAEVLTPNLVLLDFLMPGMNGIDVANALKQLLPKTRIAIFSNYTHDFGERLSSAWDRRHNRKGQSGRDGKVPKKIDWPQRHLRELRPRLASGIQQQC